MAHNAFKHAKHREWPITKTFSPTSCDAEKYKNLFVFDTRLSFYRREMLESDIFGGFLVLSEISTESQSSPVATGGLLGA